MADTNNERVAGGALLIGRLRNFPNHRNINLEKRSEAS